MKTKCCFHLFLFAVISLAASESRHIIDLKGQWEFDQTEQAFPPESFTRTIPVPGLIHLAEPRIDQYELLFPQSKKVEFRLEHDVTDLQYEPRYNWYRKTVRIPKDLKDKSAVLSILKSKYVTQVYVNGLEAGQSMACYTPIDLPVHHALKYGEDNEIMIRVGDRAWLPSAAAGSTDKEKVNYIPGIWDDVMLSFTDVFRVHRNLILPDLDKGSATVKMQIRNFNPPQLLYGTSMWDTCSVTVHIREKKSGKHISQVTKVFPVKRDNLTECEMTLPVPNPNLWSPDEPFLYEAEIVVYHNDKVSDQVQDIFGMRHFGRAGKRFTLNGEVQYLRGSNITLHRFFEDPDCAGLPWDRDWVRTLLNDIPKTQHWNAMRICVGLVPDFWYDIADEAGLMLQNEWLYWQNHGWDEQVHTEYTDWVWHDGNHPSIIIWDAINENWDPFIGNVLIPELKQLDPTRIWDAGYMTGSDMGLDEMDEPHPYMVGGWRENLAEWLDNSPYPLGDLDYWPDRWFENKTSAAAQLANEYGWVWLWRNGLPAHLTVRNYAYYLGDYSHPETNREFQAYWLQCQTEWLRTERSMAGVLAFCYLTNNYGFTGDWFVDDIKDLKSGPVLKWFPHCFAPSAVFIDLEDQRYVQSTEAYQPGSDLLFNLSGVTDEREDDRGEVILECIDASGRVCLKQIRSIVIPKLDGCRIPVQLKLPDTPGGYLILSQFYSDSFLNKEPQLSRRYIRIGRPDEYQYFEYKLKDIQ